ncbi:MAG: aldehyde ferredoxin oxidoreductase C-terminal domain-containing protein [Acidobacteriota bacterium]|nr:aldehyde ferredoxin oxidoreductase C-terminal domain-containing protein [Acidobacteriota bacterium]
MTVFGNALFGYQGIWAAVDLANRTIKIEPADSRIYKDYVGGRGVQARILFEHLRKAGPLKDPLGPDNRIVIGTAAPNDTFIATAGRGSCSFISPMTRSPETVSWAEGHEPLYGLITHSSAGGLFPNMLKRAGVDHLIIDGRASAPVRILVTEGGVQILDAEEELFESVGGRKTVRRASAITDFLSQKYPGSSTVCLGPAGWNQAAFACLTGDYHRNFGRGGAGAVFGSKNLVAVTASGRAPVAYADAAEFQKLSRELDARIKSHVNDPSRTVSFRPAAGTTWWLDRAFNGKYLGKSGGYLPWRNFDEGYFDPRAYAGVSTAAFLEISGKHAVCSRCRHIMCTRSARVEGKPYAAAGVRPEFETIALWINCCITDRDAIFYMNHLCNDLGIDTMTAGSVMSGAMELAEKGYLRKHGKAPAFGSAVDMIRTLRSIAHRRDDLGILLGEYSDRVIAELSSGFPPADTPEIARCVTTAFGGLGYAGIEPKSFPGMFAAYATSNRGRGDHTYAWTIQAEESGLEGVDDLASYVAAGQAGKALVDSLGLCDFFCEDVTSDLFLSLYRALTGFEYSAGTMAGCGRRIYALERHVNNIQGRGRSYDAYVPPKLTVRLKAGAHEGRAVDLALHKKILDAYYGKQGWSGQGIVGADLLKELGIMTKEERINSEEL